MTYTVAELNQALDGRYRVERVIGTGGMAQVFLGTDLHHDRQVAIKVLHPEIAQALGPARFLREIAIVSKLAHPNIVPLYDSGERGSLLYYVMPFVEGSSLRDLLVAQNRLPLDEALRIATDVAEALSYAHAAGIVHRDIKPENILLGPAHAVVTDFGIAKAILAAGGERLTSGRVVLGTPAYMSPEQAGGEAVLDGRSDLYSLALVIYEMLAGDVPYRAPTPEGLLGRKFEAQYPRLQVIRSTIPAALDAAIARGLAADPADRFKNTAEFAAALHSAQSQVAGPAQRARWKVGLAIGLGALAVVAATTLLRPPASPPTGGGKRLIVAPLVNRSGIDSLDAVGVMTADWVTEGLQRTGVVEVVPTPTAVEASRFASRDTMGTGARDPVRSVANETGAGLVIAGSFYREGDRLLFRVQIVEAAGSRVLAALENIEAPITNPLKGIDEVRSRLMGWLALHYDERLRAYVTTGDRPPTYLAYQAFSEGLTYYIGSQNAQALPLFLRAARLDSSFAPALLYASFCLTNLGTYPAADSLLHVVERKREGLSRYNQAWLDFRLALVAGNHEAAFEAIREAARMAPESKATYNYAAAALQSGHLREADSALRKLPPERGAMRGFVGYWILQGELDHFFRRFDREYQTGTTARGFYPRRLAAFIPSVRARAAQGQMAELATELRAAEPLAADPLPLSYGDLLQEAAEELRAHGYAVEASTMFSQARSWYQAADRGPNGRWRRAQLAYGLGSWEEARALLDTLLKELPANPDYRGMLGLIHARLGERARADSVGLVLAADQRPYQRGAPSLFRARIAAVLGDRNAAVTLLRKAFTEGRAYDLWLHRDADFAPLRGYAPFDDLVRAKP